MLNKESISPLILKMVPVGSRVTCSPPPENTDQDYLCLIKYSEDIYELGPQLLAKGWSWEGDEVYFTPAEEDEPEEFGFQSFRKGDVNLIITGSEQFFKDFVHASNIARKLNLKDKQQRIDLFQIIIYDSWGDEPCVTELDKVPFE